MGTLEESVHRKVTLSNSSFVDHFHCREQYIFLAMYSKSLPIIFGFRVKQDQRAKQG